LSRVSVTAVRSVDLAVQDLDAARAFFTDVWNLQEVAAADGIVYLRATGPCFHALSLRSASATDAGLVRVVMQAHDRRAIDSLFEQVTRFGTETDGAPRLLHTPGGGYGFGFKDPEKRNLAVICDPSDHPDASPRPDRPNKLSHVNLNCRDNDATFGFFRDVLGFKLSDQTRQFRFIRCNPDHHSLVLGFNDNANLNHIAFEMPDLDSVMRGIGRMRDHGYAVEWGPGRHGPGNNVFAYFCGPGELPIEYTGEMLEVDDSYRVGMPQDWTWPPGRLDHWGITPGPSARVKKAQAFFQFTREGFRLDG
jgi:catechol 2,3-dioxygenase-like lactoylglutathione lyase family enzyme